MKRIVVLGLGLTVLPLSAFAVTPEEFRACEADPSGAGCTELATQLAACEADVTADGCGPVLLAHDLAVNWPAPDEAEAEEAAAKADAGEEEAEAPAAGLTEGSAAEALEARAAEAAAEDTAVPAADAGEETAVEAADSDVPAGLTEGSAAEALEARAAEAAAEDAAADEAFDACPVLDSTGWRAAVGEVAGGKGAHLVVTGTVTLPTPGWRLELAPGIADRSARPVQHFQLLAFPPAGITTQVLTDYEAYVETPALGPVTGGRAPYSGVIVHCEGRVLAEITSVGLSR